MNFDIVVLIEHERLVNFGRSLQLSPVNMSNTNASSNSKHELCENLKSLVKEKQQEEVNVKQLESEIKQVEKNTKS